ncbi:MAG: peptide chain release factor 1 [Chloroflexota bacterium]|nr:peptide chain release factor 1 [Chloroflexota bacterium]
MFERIENTVERYEELNRLLASPEVAQNPQKIRVYAKERAEIADIVHTYREYKDLTAELEDTRAMLDEENGPEMRAMIREEIVRLQEEADELEHELKYLLLPKDPRDARNVIVEIRAGAGGDEAALFAADLFRMYSIYAEERGWKTKVLSTNETGIGGFKEIIFQVKGEGAFSRLKYERGVHRVQRVPVTESSGRIHTSTATVAVLPEVDEVEVSINPEDLRTDVFRAGGHGGQNVNKVESAVRITHIPTGLVVQCQDERSQRQNRERAMSILRARIYDMEYERQMTEIDEARRKQVGSAERSEKIRTYNFPQNRVTDHRIGMSVHRLEEVLSGDLDPFIEGLIENEQKEALATQVV